MRKGVLAASRDMVRLLEGQGALDAVRVQGAVMDFLEYVSVSVARQQVVMGEYRALVDALVECEQELEPGLSWSEAFERARERYQRLRAFTTTTAERSSPSSDLEVGG